MNNTIIEILNDFKNLEYENFISDYNELIKFKPSNKPNLIVLNHALLPLTDIWNKSMLSIMLTGKESILVERFIKRENLDSSNIKYTTNIFRHMKLYTILNKDEKADVVYDTTNNFMDVKDIEKIYRGDIKKRTKKSDLKWIIIMTIIEQLELSNVTINF